MAGFQRGAAAPPPRKQPAARPAAQPAASAMSARQQRMAQYHGAVSEAREPMLPAGGPYRIRFTAVEEPPPPPGKDPWAIFRFTVEGSNDPDVPEGGAYAALFPISSRAMAASGPKINALCVAAAGFEDQAAFFEWDAQSEYYCASLGEQNALAAEGYTLVGRVADVKVHHGKETATGDYYREYTWYPVPEEEQG